MSILHILKIELKTNMKSILKMSIALSLFMLLMLLMFDPELFGGMEEMLDAYPEEILAMIGGTISLGTLTGFITMEFLSIIWMWVGIYIILKAAQDIPTAIDNKSIDLILSKPIKRWEYAMGKHLRLIFSLLIIFVSMLLMVAIMVLILPNLKDEPMIWKEWIATFFWAFLFCTALESTAFLVSTWLPRKKASGTAFLIFLIFFIFGLYYGYFDESLHWVRYLSIFNYYDPGSIMVEHTKFIDVGWDVAILIGYSMITTWGSIIIFNRRDIPV